MKRLLTVLAVLGLLLAACGDDDATDDPTETTDATETTEADTDGDTDGGDEDVDGGDDDEDAADASDDEYVAALSAGLNEDGSFPGTDEDAECLANGFLDAMGGPDALRDAGVTPTELRDSEGPTSLGLDLDEQQLREDLTVAFSGCDIDLIALLSQSLGAQTPEGFEDCVRGQLSNEQVANVFASTIVDPEDQSALAEVLPVLEGCAAPPTSAPG